MIPVSPPTVAQTVQRADIRLTEWDEAGPDSHPEALGGLSLGDNPSTRALVRRLAQQRIVEIVELRGGLRVRTTSYVGRIAVGPLEISILPKVAWQRWLGLFSYALRLRGLVRTEEVVARLSATSLHDLVVLELLAEARDLIGRGLHCEYVGQRKELAAPRGRIDFSRLARQGGIRDATIPCRYTRRSDDFPLNRVLLGGLALARRLTTDLQLRADVGRLAQQLADTVGIVELTAEAVRKAQSSLDRRTRRYAPSLELIDLLRRGMLVSMERPTDGEVIPLRGFALNMHVLWQRLLARVLREWLPDLEVKEEYGLPDLLRTDPAYSSRRRGRHIPRPDYAVFRQGRLITYLDAKYRDIWEKGVPRDMLYQLALYASAHEGGMAAMLYPTEDPTATEERIHIHHPQDDSVRGTVAVRPVHLEELEQLIVQPLTSQLIGRRTKFATGLVG